MDRFIPAKVYYERDALSYPLGKELLRRYGAARVETVEVEDHNNIPELRAQPDAAFPRMKRLLVIGVRKSLRYVPNEKTSDYLVPYTSSGCPAMCLYCYLVCNYFKCAYLRVFVNREAMMDKLLRTAHKEPREAVFEIGSNSDLVIENTVTGNLEWTIRQFGQARNGLLTFPTKFHMVDSLLPLQHNGRVIVRMSVNPEFIVRHVELFTSPLDLRIEALIRLHRAGYRTGLLIAPVVLLDGWEKMYEGLVIKLARDLPQDLKRILKIEIIFMTYGYALRTINEAAFPGAVALFDGDRMRPGGRGKYRYTRDVAQHARQVITALVQKHLGECEIAYIC